MRQADDELVTAVADGDAVGYDAMNRLPARDVLNLCVAYLRRRAAEIKAAKGHGRGRTH